MYNGLFLVHLFYPEQIATSLVMFDFGDLLKMTGKIPEKARNRKKPRHMGLKSFLKVNIFFIFHSGN